MQKYILLSSNQNSNAQKMFFLAKKQKKRTDAPLDFDLESCIFEKTAGLVVHDEAFRELRLLQQGQDILVVGNVGAEVCIATQYDRHLVSFAKL